MKIKILLTAIVMLLAGFVLLVATAELKSAWKKRAEVDHFIASEQVRGQIVLAAGPWAQERSLTLIALASKNPADIPCGLNVRQRVLFA